MRDARSSGGSFYSRRPTYMVEVMWQEIVGQNLLWKAIVKTELIVSNTSIFLAIVQNLLLLFDSTIMFDAVTVPNGGVPDKQWNEAYQTVRTVLGSIQVVTCILAALVTLGRQTLLSLLKKWIDLKGLTMKETMKMMSRPLSNFGKLFQFISLAVWVCCFDMQLIVRVGFVVFAVLGLTVSKGGERYFVVHLLQLVLANKGLLDVLKAVTQNGRQLLLTTMLTFIIVWMFAVWGTEIRVHYPDAWLTEDGAQEALCRSPATAGSRLSTRSPRATSATC